jgi:hypothetical protein
MADITDHNDQGSPSVLDDGHAIGNGNSINPSGESRGVKRQRPVADDDDDDDDKPGRERRKIEIKFINVSSSINAPDRRWITCWVWSWGEKRTDKVAKQDKSRRYG